MTLNLHLYVQDDNCECVQESLIIIKTLFCNVHLICTCEKKV